MKKVNYLRAVFLLFLLSICNFGIMAQINIPKGIKEVRSVEGITEYRLENGLKVLLFPDPSKPTITVNITYRVGSRHEGYGETGMAHLLEHMVFKGSPKHKNIPQELTEHGARPNGTTWYDRTNYFETFSASEENLEWALDLESDRMVNSFIAKKDLESEMTVVRNEFEAGENRPGSILYERVLSTAFLWHNYGNSTIGCRADIENVPIERLQAFYHKYYQPDNAVLLVAGKIDPAKTLQLVDKYFSGIPRPDRTLNKIYPTYTRDPEQDGERSVTLKRIGDVQAVSCLYHVPAGAHPDHSAIRVLNELLTSEPAGRLYKALVETKKATSVWGFSPQLKEPSYIYFNAEVRKEKSVDEARSAMLQTLDDLTKTPPTQEEVDRAKSKLLKHWEMGFNDANRVGIMLSGYIAQGDWRLLFQSRDQLKKVTPDDVFAVAQKYFKPTNRTLGTFIPVEKQDNVEVPEAPKLEDLLKDFKGGKAISVGEAFDPSPDNIDKRTTNIVNKDGIDISLLPKETRGNSVRAHMTFRFGTLDKLKGKSEISDLTNSMLNKGTASMTRQQIQDKLDQLKASVRIYGGLNNTIVEIETDKEHLNDVILLVSDMVKHPSMDKNEFEKLIEEELANIESQKSEPNALANYKFRSLLSPYPKDDPRYVKNFDERIESIKAVTLDQVKAFHKDFYGASDATVSVVGEFDQKEIKDLLLKEFGDWKSPQAYERIPAVYFESKPANVNINTPDKANALFLAGQNIQMNVNDPDYPAMVLGNFMLGGGFLNSRLATRIRQKEGLSYGVGSWFNARVLDKVANFGSYAIYAPENRDKLEKAYMEEIHKVLKDGFTDDELKAAKTGWLQSQQVTRSQDRSLARILDDNLYYKRDMKWYKDFENKASMLTPSVIHTAMKKNIDPTRLIMVKAGDFEKKLKDKKEKKDIKP